MDKAPKEMFIGVINPFALTEAITGRKINWRDPNSIQVIEDTLEKNYAELFDIQHNSPLYTGLEITKDNLIKPMKANAVKIRSVSEQESMDFSTLKRLKDLNTAGVKNIENVLIRDGRLNKGRLDLILDIPELNNTITNRLTTPQIKDIVLGKGSGNANTEWTPTNRSWRDMGDFFNDVVEYNDPIQGAVGNCYFIAAIAAVAWASPYTIEHKVRATGTGETQRVNAIQFFTKGGGKDAPSKLIEVTDDTLVDTSNRPVYCRSNDGGEIWPAVYEKAFAKWITKNNTDKPDITRTAFGDPVKATAQLNNKTPRYYNTASRTAAQLFSHVRENSVSRKTIHPMTAWTYGSSKDYTGSNIVGNHAYTILGWTSVKQELHYLTESVGRDRTDRNKFVPRRS